MATGEDLTPVRAPRPPGSDRRAFPPAPSPVPAAIGPLGGIGIGAALGSGAPLNGGGRFLPSAIASPGGGGARPSARARPAAPVDGGHGEGGAEEGGGVLDLRAARERRKKERGRKEKGKREAEKEEGEGGGIFLHPSKTEEGAECLINDIGRQGEDTGGGVSESRKRACRFSLMMAESDAPIPPVRMHSSTTMTR